MAKQRKPATVPAVAPTLGAALAGTTTPPPAAPATLYVVGTGFKPRTNNGYGGSGKNPQVAAWAAVCAALPATHSTLVGIVHNVAQANGALVAHGPGYPASFVNKRVRTGALVPQAVPTA